MLDKMVDWIVVLSTNKKKISFKKHELICICTVLGIRKWKKTGCFNSVRKCKRFVYIVEKKEINWSTF